MRTGARRSRHRESTRRGGGALSRLARASARHSITTLIVWLLAIGTAAAFALVGVAGDTLFDRLVGAAPTAEGESSRADDLLDIGEDDGTESISLLAVTVPIKDSSLVELSIEISDRLADVRTAEVVNPLAVPLLPDGTRIPAVAPLIATGDAGFLIQGTIDSDYRDDYIEVAQEAADELRAEYPDATIEVGGGSMIIDSIVHASESDLARGESVALPIALVVMLLVFGGFLAAGAPLIGAIVSILGGLGILYVFTGFTDIDSTVINVVTAVGLALSIDYGLLMVSRFREEYRRAIDGLGGRRPSPATMRREAIARTADKAGRTVLYSGITFSIASLGLLAFEPRLMRAIGLGAIAVTMVAVMSALTLMPAIMSLWGARLVKPGLLTRVPGLGRVLSAFGDIAPPEGFFSRTTRRVQKHPAIVTIACVVLLLLVGSPIATLRIANTATDALPTSSTQYVFSEAIDKHFPEATEPRVALVTRTEADAIAWATEVENLDAVRWVGTPLEMGDGWRTVVRVDNRDGVDLVHQLREDRPAFDAWVAGVDAHTVDLTASLIAGAPMAALIVAVGTMLLLFLMTGSVLVPIKALIASALSLGASVGVLVWGFEQGNFAGIMNFDPADALGVDVLVLVLTFAFGFGLAMDYEMFILSRIKELVDSGVDDVEAIALGLQRSGRIISSAALIIIVVFMGFATGDLMMIKQLGVALATAVLLDATLVRCLLVPALMTWQRRIMWWSPRWLRRVYERFALSD